MRWECALLVLLLPHLALADAARVVVPITQVTLPNGDIRYSVPVRVGESQPFPALLDTGSTGLRVFRTLIPAAFYNDTNLTSVSAFSAGDQLEGTVGEAPVAVGDALTNGAVPFELVDRATCLESRPRCGAMMLTPHDYGIGGDGIAGQGFQAILGIGLGNVRDSVNPLMHMGDRRWVIELPEPGTGNTGQLIINPTAGDVRDAESFQLNPQPGGWFDTLPGCLVNRATTQQICGPAILDTGSPGMIAFVPNAPETTLWRPGEAASLSFTSAANASVTIPFTVDQAAGTGLLQQPATDGEASLLSGFLPFFYNDVLYDGAHGTIALAPRPDAPNPATAVAAQTNAASAIEVIEMNAPGSLPQPAANGMPVVITPTN
ncbi:MAG: hypothetical protein B7Z75_12545 [Acidocella sp. 20-57-95]|nr:MAG: hypothetical protein B7Z75_12545 [Acidocella sp. 20-57-95]OYV62384.1 MAG: hypothetical protein B7Z71_01380 [Acidocella sp. 21-58-7]HQT63098.1 hypothetical protein [Acidocella sp.]HQU03817.1 hypothetical protein [Acidocella sp.]